MAGPTPPLPWNQVTIQVGVPPAVAASANAVVERSAIFRVTVKLVPSSPTDASRMSSAGWLALDTGITGYGASFAASLAQLPGGSPCVPLTEMVPALTEAPVIFTFAVAPYGSKFPLAAYKLGPVRKRMAALMGLPMYSL